MTESTFTLREALESAMEEGQDENHDEEAPEQEQEDTEQVVDEAESDEEEANTEDEGEPEGPTYLSVDERKVLSTAPKEVRELVDKRFRDLQSKRDKAFGELKQSKDAINALRQVLEPYQPYIQAQNTDALTAINSLFSAYTAIVNNPREGIAALAKQMGVDLSDSSEPEYVDPQVQALQKELAQIKQSFGQMQTSAQRTAASQIAAQIQSFREQTDAQGQPLHPYFEEVEQDMVPYVQNGMSLEESYQRAVWANPETREKLQAQQIVSTSKKPRKPKPKRGTGGGRPASEPRSGRGGLRKDLEEVFAAAKNS